MKAGLSRLSLDGGTVDDEVSEVSEELLSTVLRGDELEELGSVVDEGGPSLLSDEDGRGENAEEEGDVGLDTCATRRGSVRVSRNAGG